ncbi:oxidoreductase [Microvirga flavescens]|uniref:oxidoreductase n=1 Tax=Microvirga flavescens TaxID=2249811 RepID=UPI0013003DA6|nr:oxidoreductase [Microvirga flavescens]
MRVQLVLYIVSLIPLGNVVCGGMMIVRCFAVLFAALLMSTQIRADEVLPSPTGPIILVVTGKIRNANAPGQARFDKAMLDQLGHATITTHSSWWDGAKTAEGIPLRKILERVGAYGENLRATALNDYQVIIPVSDLKYEPILATVLDGKALNVRDRGPLWVVYPIDQYPNELKTERADSHWIWQLRSLNVE